MNETERQRLYARARADGATIDKLYCGVSIGSPSTEKADLDYRLKYVGGQVKNEDYSDTAKRYGLRELTPKEREAYVSADTRSNPH